MAILQALRYDGCSLVVGLVRCFSGALPGAFVAFFPVLCCRAGTYQLAPDEVAWRLDEKKYVQCSMTQHINLLGDLSVVARAGRSAAIHFVSTQMGDGVDLHDLRMVYEQKSGEVTHMLAGRSRQSYRGWDLTLSVPMQELLYMFGERGELRVTLFGRVAPWMHQKGSILTTDVVVPAINAEVDPVDPEAVAAVPARRPVFGRMRDCVGRLMARDMSKIERFVLRFPAAVWAAQPDHHGWLQDAARYVAVDDRIVGVAIEGHSDATGFRRSSETISRMKNIDLSGRRAETVRLLLEEQLAALDLGREVLIKVRVHGDRYPAATNATAAGREKNRRVEITWLRAKSLIPGTFHVGSEKSSSAAEADRKATRREESGGKEASAQHKQAPGAAPAADAPAVPVNGGAADAALSA